ncbi:hypothetical protein ACEPPN_007661 [Leptodophora sp. 'Broadleaf-Isolate-01']
MEENSESFGCSACVLNHISFRYTPLKETRAIRLLLLQPGQRDEDVYCTLENTSLDDERVIKWGYTALSYVWGNPSPASTIFCNEVHFHVTKNLEDALRTLRQPDEPRTLWIDQICINQGDNNERRAQVQIMRQIYEKANQVIAWLGAPTTDSKVALDFALELVEMMQETLDPDLRPFGLEDSEPSTSDLEVKAMEIVHILGYEDPGWLALRRLFERDWFSRVWVIQEAMVAKDLILYWGPETIRWEVIVELVLNLNRFHLLGTKIFQYRSTATGHLLIMRVQQCKERRAVSLHDLLLLSSGHCSTDPRDKIYALLGLIQNSRDYGIIPDYDIAVITLFQNITKGIFEHHSSLQLRTTAISTGPDQRLEGLPSWCPDWSSHDMSIKNRAHRGWENFEADGNRQATFTWHEDPSLLTLRGKIIDTVSDQSVLFAPPLFEPVDGEQLGSNLLAHYRQLAALLDSCKQLCLSSNCSGNEKYTYWRALIGGLDVDGYLAKDIYSQHFYYYERHVQHAASVTKYEDVNSIMLSWSLEQIVGRGDFARSVIQAGNERRFTLTENGRLGWLPVSAQSGDQIAILHGSKMPWVIRRQDDNKWILICCCYVDGVMVGEIVGDNEFPTEDVTFC